MVGPKGGGASHRAPLKYATVRVHSGGRELYSVFYLELLFIKCGFMFWTCSHMLRLIALSVSFVQIDLISFFVCFLFSFLFSFFKILLFLWTTFMCIYMYFCRRTACKIS